MKLRPDSGSTLIELLISITIVGVILVIIMGAFHIGIRAWETGERDVVSFQRQQIVLSIVKRQLSSICLQPTAMEGLKPFIFKGDQGLVDFISSVPIIPGNHTGNVRVTYRIRQNDDNDMYVLEIAERSVLTGGMAEPIDQLDDDMVHELIANAYDIRFEYLKKTAAGKERQWQPEWDEEDDTGLPAAVKCVLQMEEKNPPVTVIARVLSEGDTA